MLPKPLLRGTSIINVNYWHLVSFVKRGRVRRQVLSTILTEPRMPAEIARITKNHRPSVSRALLELKEKGLVECLTPNEKLGRLYKVTESGVKLLKKIGIS